MGKYINAVDLFNDIQLGIATLEDLKRCLIDQWSDGYDEGYDDANEVTMKVLWHHDKIDGRD